MRLLGFLHGAIAPDFTTPMMRIVRAPESVTRRPTASVTKARRANVSLTIDTARSALIARVECPPPTHRHPHRFEIAGGDDVEAQFGVFAGLRLIALCAESPASGAESRVRTRLAASTPGSARTRSTADW